MSTAARSSATATGELVLSRIFEAPLGVVFRAWTEAETFARWFGPHGSRMPVCTLEARPGGRLHYQHVHRDMADVWVAGTFEDVVRDERIVFTCHFSDPEGGRVSRPGFPAEMRIAVVFEALSQARTAVTVRHTGLVRDQGEGEGWMQGFERLAAELAPLGGGVAGATTFLYPPDRPVMISRRLYEAPRPLVWEALTRPEHVKAWWGPRGYVNTETELDVRPGGAWRVTQLGPDGAGPYRFHGEYLEVAPPERLVNTFVFAGAEDDPAVETHVLQATPDGTLLVSESRFPSMEARAAAMEHGMEWGATEAWDRLAEVLDAVAGSTREDELVLARTFDAPREAVWEAWGAAEHLDRWFGPRGFVTRTQAMDFRVGGEWRYDMTAPDGTVYPNRVRYEVMEPPARLVYAHDAGEDDDPHGFRTEVTFEATAEGGTRVTMRMRLASRAARDFTIAFGAVELGHQTLQKLAEHLAG